MSSKLTRTDAVASGDLFVLYKASDSDFRGCPTNKVMDFIKSQLGQVNFVTQSEVVAASGFNVNVTDNGGNVWLILRPAATYAVGAITLPALANAVDGQEVMVFCTRQITTFTVNANGAVGVYGEPTSLAADSFFKLRFDANSNGWYRVA